MYIYVERSLPNKVGIIAVLSITVGFLKKLKSKMMQPLMSLIVLLNIILALGVVK